MASEREAAKGAVVKKDADDPELTNALANASKHQLELKREDNRHKETMNQQNLGSIGSLFGDGKNIPMAVALIAVVFGVLGAAGCWIVAANVSASELERAKFWAEQAERALGFAGLALGYILGKGTK